MAVKGREQKVQSGCRGNAVADYCAPFDVKMPANNNSPEKVISNCLKKHMENVKPSKPRKADKRLWESLSELQLRGAQKIYVGFQLRVFGMGVRTQVFSGLPRGCRVVENRSSETLELFAIWAKEAHRRGIAVGSILDVLVFGKSCREVDRDQRRRKGFAKENLVAGLGVFEKIEKKYNY